MPWSHFHWVSQTFWAERGRETAVREMRLPLSPFGSLLSESWIPYLQSYPEAPCSIRLHQYGIHRWRTPWATTLGLTRRQLSFSLNYHYYALSSSTKKFIQISDTLIVSYCYDTITYHQSLLSISAFSPKNILIQSLIEVEWLVPDFITFPVGPGA